METLIILISFATLMLILSIFLFFGKGSWVIAGYNTSSAEEKAKYNKKKLCRAMSIVTIVVSIFIYIMAYLGYKVDTGVMNENDMLPFAIVFIVVLVFTIGITMYYANTRCKNEK